MNHRKRTVFCWICSTELGWIVSNAFLRNAANQRTNRWVKEENLLGRSKYPLNGHFYFWIMNHTFWLLSTIGHFTFFEWLYFWDKQLQVLLSLPTNFFSFIPPQWALCEGRLYPSKTTGCCHCVLAVVPLFTIHGGAPGFLSACDFMATVRLSVLQLNERSVWIHLSGKIKALCYIIENENPLFGQDFAFKSVKSNLILGLCAE